MIDVAYFTAFLFVFIRLTSFFSFVPVFFPKGFPNIGKVAFAGMISFIVMPGIDLSGFAITNNLQLVTAIGCEVTTGLTLGYFTNLCFNSIKFAGQLLDTEIGFGMLSMFDPTTSTNSTFIETLLYWLALMIFFITNTHHLLIMELINSFNVLGVGKFILSEKSSMLIIRVFIDYFGIGLKIAMPIIIIIIITDLTMGLVARTVPQLNVMILGLPIKIVLGLACISISLPIFANAINANYAKIPGMFRDLYKVLPFIFIFAADDKTEEATPKKKQQAREKGQVAKSKEVSLTFTLLASTLVFALLSSYATQSLRKYLLDFYSNHINTTLGYSSVFKIMVSAVEKIGMIILPFIVPIMIFGVIGNLVQTGFMLTLEPIKPQLSKLSPLKGLKRMFSMKSLVDLLKNLAMVTVIGYIGYQYIYSNFDKVLYMGNLSFAGILAVFNKLAVGIFVKITFVLIVIALIDYIYQRRNYNKDLKMSKQEVKEEYKQQEGDPQIKGKIRQKQREMASRRMMSEVPDATVVVTNPTHIAVALKYVEGKSEAPILVAKGADRVALKIKEIAKENDIPIIENKPLARLIYSEVELESEIPTEMYQAIAEILALVFKMKKRK